MLLLNSVKCKKLSLRNTILGISQCELVCVSTERRKCAFLGFAICEGAREWAERCWCLSGLAQRPWCLQLARQLRFFRPRRKNCRRNIPPLASATARDENERERDRDIKREKKAHDLFWPTPRQWARSLIFWPNQTDSPQNDFHATSTQLPTPLLKPPQITQMRFIIETKTPL